jgi:hypothetical protein
MHDRRARSTFFQEAGSPDLLLFGSGFPESIPVRQRLPRGSAPSARCSDYVSFLLLIFLFSDLTPSVALVQDLTCRFRAPIPKRVSSGTGRWAAHHGPPASPHHKKAEHNHDDHEDGKYPPPSKSTAKTVVSPHLNHLLSGRLTCFTNSEIACSCAHSLGRWQHIIAIGLSAWSLG